MSITFKEIRPLLIILAGFLLELITLGFFQGRFIHWTRVALASSVALPDTKWWVITWALWWSSVMGLIMYGNFSQEFAVGLLATCVGRYLAHCTLRTVLARAALAASLVAVMMILGGQGALLHALSSWTIIQFVATIVVTCWVIQYASQGK